MIALTKTGRTMIAQLLKNTPMHLAWGTGDANWSDDDKKRAALIGETDLTAEIARRSVVITGYATPDASGDIEFDGVKYAVSVDPTEHLYLKCVFEAGDDATATIRELGLFIGCETDSGLPAGQQYFAPSQVTEKGQLFALSRLSHDIIRSPDTKQIFEFVIPVVQ